jgi:hypothetical protein
VSGCRKARARGPISANSAHPLLTSVTVANSPGRIDRRSQSASRMVLSAAVSTTNSSAPVRVTVTSASIPPVSFSHCV